MHVCVHGIVEVSVCVWTALRLLETHYLPSLQSIPQTYKVEFCRFIFSMHVHFSLHVSMETIQCLCVYLYIHSCLRIMFGRKYMCCVL